MDQTIQLKNLDRMTAFLADEYKDYKNPFYDETKESKLDVDNLIFENTELCNNKSRVAYDKGLDLYAMIAQSAYNNDYWDNMEFNKEFTKIKIDGADVVCGSGKEMTKELNDDNTILLPTCYAVYTSSGYIDISDLAVGQKIINSQSEELEIIRIEAAPQQEIDGIMVDFTKIYFKTAYNKI